MGWWWGSNANPQTPVSNSNPQTPVSKPSEPTPDPASTAPPPPASIIKLSRDEQAERELEAAWAEVKAAIDKENEATAAAENEPLETSNFPTTMSCRQAFDEAFYCQSLGGQFNNIYRYGQLRSCSEHWSDFWFCMRTRQLGDKVKAKQIVERYRQKEAKYRSGPSSEDVWDERKPGEELKNPFSKDPDTIDIPGLPKRRKQQA